LASDQTAIVHFGLGKDDMVKSLKINYADGDVLRLDSLQINATINAEKALINRVKDTLLTTNEN